MNERAWKTAAALAAACGLDWGRWATSPLIHPAVAAFIDDPDDPERQAAAREAMSHAPHYPPVPASIEAAAEAYRADCERRGVEPGPMPSREYGRCGDPLWWAVYEDDGAVSATVGTGYRNAWRVTSDGTVHFSDVAMGMHEASERFALATAAACAMGSAELATAVEGVGR